MSGSLRTETAAIGGVTLQIVQEWVLKLHAYGLIDHQRGNTASTDIFGAMCPITEQTAAPVRPCCTKAATGPRLLEISARVTPGKHCARLTDQPWWVMSTGYGVGLRSREPTLGVETHARTACLSTGFLKKVLQRKLPDFVQKSLYIHIPWFVQDHDLLPLFA